jgi:transcriptional regulator with XRE-family HTH domain
MAVSVKETWGRNVREQRIALGMSQQRLADKVGVDQSLVSYWEHGHKAPSVERQLAIARALGVAPRVLFQFPEVA